MILTHQDVVDAIFKKMDETGLSEKSWIRKLEGNWDTVNRQLWECLVALYLADLGYQPKRFSQDKTNLDFGFSINDKSFYGECVCPVDGVNLDAFKPWAEDEYQPVAGGQFASRSSTTSDVANQAGLRVTQALTSKQQQAKNFHDLVSADPTIVFLCTGLLNGVGIPNCRLDSLPMLSSTTAALYGIDGVPAYGFNKHTNQWLGAFAIHSSNLLKLSGTPINRMGFRDGSLGAISAVMNCSILPLKACTEYLNGELIKNIFNEHAELIVNSSAGNLALDDIAIFPSAVSRIFLHKDGIVLHRDDKQAVFPVQIGQPTLRQAQGERSLLDERTSQ